MIFLSNQVKPLPVLCLGTDKSFRHTSNGSSDRWFPVSSSLSRFSQFPSSGGTRDRRLKLTFNSLNPVSLPEDRGDFSIRLLPARIKDKKQNKSLKWDLTDLRWQLDDGVSGDLEHSELGEQGQVVGQLPDLRPSDVPLSQVGHPLQLPGEVLQKHPLSTSYQLFSYRWTMQNFSLLSNGLHSGGRPARSDPDPPDPAHLSDPAAPLLTGKQKKKTTEELNEDS